MKNRKRTAKPLALFLACALLTAFLSACWDNDELDNLLIATGLCLDAVDGDRDAVAVSVQVGSIHRNVGGQGGLPAEKPFKTLDAVNRNILGALYQIRNKTSRELFMHHVQVIVLGTKLSEQGISEYLDFLLRDREMRMETWLVLAKEDAAELVSDEYVSGQLPTITLATMIQNLSLHSPHLGVNVMEFVSKHLSDSYCPVVPLIENTLNGDDPAMSLVGLGVFVDGKLVGTLNLDETEGYLWAMCGLNDGVLNVHTDLGFAALKIMSEEGNPKISMDKDGNITLKLGVTASFIVGEMVGFEDVLPTEAGAMIEAGAAAEVERKILLALHKSQELGADILGIGEQIYRKHPKQWEKIKDNWTEIYRSLEPEFDISIVIRSTGKSDGILKDDSSKK